MPVSKLLCLSILVLCTRCVLSDTVNILATTPPVDSTKELKDAIYTTFTGGPACVILLNATGEIGCSTPGSYTDGILVRTNTSLLTLPQNSVALISPDNAATLLEDCIPTGCPNLAGVLVESGRPPSFSSASKAPLSNLALFGNPLYPWNPDGSSLLRHRFTFPVLLLDNTTTDNAITRVTYNEQILAMTDSNAGQQNVAKISLNMEAEGGNSTACLASNTCVPLGGYSSIAALPPLGGRRRPTTEGQGNTTGTGTEEEEEEDSPTALPALLVVAAVDTASFFHGGEQAADAPLSGLIAMLTAARVLGKHPAMQSSRNVKRRIYFGAMVGEPWDLMGSKRLLWEASQPGTNISSILSLDAIDSIIEVGQIGRAADNDGGRVQLFTHANPASSSSSSSKTVVDALEKAAAQVTATTGDISNNNNNKVVSVSPSAITTELPPGSTNALLRVLPQDTPAIALTEFDTAFINPYFTSQYDTVDQVSNSTMAATASVLIRALFDFAVVDDSSNTTNTTSTTGERDISPPPPLLTTSLQPLVVNETFVLETVEELSACLMTADPGLYCTLSTDMITPAYGPVPSHYVGILRWPTSDPQDPDPNSKKDIERFIWNYLAFATSGTDPSLNNNEHKGENDDDGDTSSDNTVVALCTPYNTTACIAGEVCAGARDLPSPQGMGLCLRATVQYVASYSTSLTYVNSTWQTTDQAEQWEVEYGWPQPDPMWTESNWPVGVPSVEMYLNESESVDVAILIAGVVVTVVSILVAGTLIAAYRKRMKQD